MAFAFALLITSWCFCIVNKNPMFRKVALLYNVVAILTYLNTPDVALDVIFKNLLVVAGGVVCALAASFIPWPVMGNR